MVCVHVRGGGGGGGQVRVRVRVSVRVRSGLGGPALAFCSNTVAANNRTDPS
jgi:hypothetical protein